MIKWQLPSGAEYFPLFPNAISSMPTSRTTFSSTITKEFLTSFFEEVQVEGIPACIDMGGVDILPEHHLGTLCGLPIRDIIFINCTQGLIDQIHDDLPNCHPLAEIGIVIVIGDSIRLERIILLAKELNISDIRSNYCQTVVKSCLEPFPEGETLPSSSVNSSKYFNAKKIFSNPPQLRMISYYLAESLWNSDLRSADLIFSCSHTGSLFASIVAQLVQKPFYSMLNLGPSLALKSRFGMDKLRNKNIVLIADMICMGTELRVTESIVKILDGNLLGAIAITRYNSSEKYSVKSLVGRKQLENMQYHVTIPPLSAEQ